MINKPLVRKWIKALNSGLYHESHNDQICSLDNSTGNHCFCAFGVLLDILSAEKFDWTGKFNDYYDTAEFIINEDKNDISCESRKGLEFAAEQLNIDFEEALDLSNRYEGIDNYDKELSYKKFAKYLKETYL